MAEDSSPPWFQLSGMFMYSGLQRKQQVSVSYNYGRKHQVSKKRYCSVSVVSVIDEVVFLAPQFYQDGGYLSSSQELFHYPHYFLQVSRTFPCIQSLLDFSIGEVILESRSEMFSGKSFIYL